MNKDICSSEIKMRYYKLKNSDKRILKCMCCHKTINYGDIYEELDILSTDETKFPLDSNYTFYFIFIDGHLTKWVNRQASIAVLNKL